LKWISVFANSVYHPSIKSDAETTNLPDLRIRSLEKSSQRNDGTKEATGLIVPES
jgi:hypothetical protein